MDKNRFVNNMCILTELTEYLGKHSDLRFIQALWNLGIVNNEDRFYEESHVTLKKVKEEQIKEVENANT